MHLKKLLVQGYRAAAVDPLECEFNGRFNLLLGANGSGKTTISEAIYMAHSQRFPRLPPVDAAALGPLPRSVSVEYAFEADEAEEGALGLALKSGGSGPPEWARSLERSLGKVRAGPAEGGGWGLDCLRLVYLPALRNPVDELSRRNAQVLLELLRAEQARHTGGNGLAAVRAQAQNMLQSLSTQQLLVDVQARIASNLRSVTEGVREHFAFVGTQRVDDAYLARVLELLLSSTPDPTTGLRLEASSLGYVNLLHIAVTLAGIPDPGKEKDEQSSPEEAVSDNSSDESDEGTNTGEENARERLNTAMADAEADKDSFFPELFHATVLIEEPEAHLHPQLQYGLIRYLRNVAAGRPDLQVIVATHAADLIAACDPEEIVIARRERSGRHVARSLAAVQVPNKKALMSQTRLHMDATRSTALFGERILVVEGVTEAILVRVLAREWAKTDRRKVAFVDALSILPLGRKIGQWPIRLLASPGYELLTRVAALSDTDKRGEPPPNFNPPKWHSELNPEMARFFWSRPTLEPTLVPGNEAHVRTALGAMALKCAEPVTSTSVDDLFRKGDGAKRKGEFALAFADALANATETVSVPEQIAEVLDWLYESTEDGVDPEKGGSGEDVL